MFKSYIYALGDKVLWERGVGRVEGKAEGKVAAVAGRKHSGEAFTHKHPHDQAGRTQHIIYSVYLVSLNRNVNGPRV